MGCSNNVDAQHARSGAIVPNWQRRQLTSMSARKRRHFVNGTVSSKKQFCEKHGNN